MVYNIANSLIAQLFTLPVGITDDYEAHKVIGAYNAWDINSVIAYWTPDCQHQQ
jgi:hypothetical protein